MTPPQPDFPCTASDTEGVADSAFAWQEDEYGRARVHTQWGDDEADIEEAVQMCPVDCISYVGMPASAHPPSKA